MEENIYTGSSYYIGSREEFNYDVDEDVKITGRQNMSVQDTVDCDLFISSVFFPPLR